MTADHDDSVLDACLDEVLGGHTPPDLTARILRAWDSRGEATAAEPPPILTGVPQALVETPANPVVALRGDAAGRYRQRLRSLRGPTIAMALGAARLGLSIVIALLVSSSRSPIARVP